MLVREQEDAASKLGAASRKCSIVMLFLPRRLGNKPVVLGSENPVCSQAQTLGSRKISPIQCLGSGRYLTLYRKLDQASDMYICQVLVYLSGG
jgi:hypothetical protein